MSQNQSNVSPRAGSSHRKVSGNAKWAGLPRRHWLLVIVLVVAVFCGDRIIRARHRSFVASLSRDCFRLSKENRWTELAPVSERWSIVEPHKAEPWLFRAEVAENTKDWENLIRFLDRVPRDDRRAIAALVRKAAAEFEYLNRPWDGIRTCDEVLKLDPRVLLAHKQGVFFCVMTLQRAEVVRRIRHAIRMRRESPWSYAYLASASWMYSASIYRQNTRWLESDPDNETLLVARALHVYTSEVQSDLERASEFTDIPSAEEMLQRFPKNQELIAYFVNKNITDGNLELVQQLLDVIPREQSDADARFWRGRAWCEDALGQFDKAERSLKRAFELDPYWWKVHFQMHDLMRRLGRHEDSAKFLKIHQASWLLSAEIMTSNRTIDQLDEQKICRMMLDLADLIGDDEVAIVLRERVAAL